MCGRYHLEVDDEDLQAILNEVNRRLVERFREQASEIGEAAGGEIRPTNIVPVLISEKERVVPVAMRWGFPYIQGARGMEPYRGQPELKPKPAINAKQENAYDPTGRDTPSLMIKCFRESLQKRRVVVPTHGFYEWTHDDKGKAVDKFRFSEPGQHKLYLAGMYDVFTLKGIQFPHFTILTTTPNKSIEYYHNRMPVLLHREECAAWLRGENVADILTRVPFEVEAVPAA